MTQNVQGVLLKKSKQTNNDGTPKLPTSDKLVEGEIALNYAKGVETISTKNESGDVVTFSSDDYFKNQYLAWEKGTGTGSAKLIGNGGTASGSFAVSEGYETIATGHSSHAEGYATSATTSMPGVHAEGNRTYANGGGAHAEGTSTSATSMGAHAEGYQSEANGTYSHAEGNNTIANQQSAHAEGTYTTASGLYSHSEGEHTVASGRSSHAEGAYTIANNYVEHASGFYNVSSSASTEFGDSGNTLFSVGNGTYDEQTGASTRHNAFEIRQNGDIYIVNKDGNDVKLQDEIGNIEVDQVLDNTTSASTNPVSSKAVYDAVTDNELVWTNAYVTLSGAVSSHTSNNDIHVTQAEKQGLGEASGITSMTGYEIASSSGSVLTTDTLIQAIGKLEKRIAILEAALEIQNNGDIYAGGGEYESL